MVDVGKQPGLPHGPEATGLGAEICRALEQLAKARDYTRQLQCDPWEFAVEIDRLTSLGVTTSDLRWLVRKGCVEHAREVTRPGDPARKFEWSKNLAFSKETCFVMAGAASALDMGQMIVKVPRAALTPRWDADERILYLGDQIVKEFRLRSSPNQEAILSAFQEEGWPHYVDDPLSPVADQNPKNRLRDTIRWLNGKQKNHLIRFSGDGTGERVGWSLVQNSDLG